MGLFGGPTNQTAFDSPADSIFRAVEISLRYLIDHFSSSQKVRREAIERFTYNLHLREHLKPVVQDTNPVQFFLVGIPYTRKKLEIETETYDTRNWGDSIITWCRNVSVPNKETIEFLYRWFHKHTYDLVEFDVFITNLSLCAQYVERKEYYLDYIERNSKRKLFDVQDYLVYGVTVGAKIAVDPQVDDGWRQYGIAIIVSLAGTALQMPKGHAQSQALHDIETQIASIRGETVGLDLDELDLTSSKIRDQLQIAPPLKWPFLNFATLWPVYAICLILSIPLIFIIASPEYSPTDNDTNQENSNVGSYVKSLFSTELLPTQPETTPVIIGPTSRDSAQYEYNYAVSHGRHSTDNGFGTLERSLKYDSTFSPSYARMASMLSKKGDVHGAIGKVGNAIKFDSLNTEYLSQRIAYYEQVGNTQGVANDLSQLIELEGRNAKNLNKRAFAFERLNKKDSAITDLQQMRLFISERDSALLGSVSFRIATAYFNLFPQKPNKSYQLEHLNRARSYCDSTLIWLPNHNDAKQLITQINIITETR